MASKLKIDYIVCSKNAEKGKLSWEVGDDGGICTLYVELGDEKARHFERNLKWLFRKFQVENAVVNADSWSARILGMERMLFEAEQQEFLKNRTFIMSRLLEESSRTRESIPHRTSILLVLNDERWTEKELLSFFLTIKDYARDIFVVSVDDLQIQAVKHITETLYKEWGVVVHVLCKRGRCFNIALFLVKKWEKALLDICYFRVAYLMGTGMQEVTLHEGEVLYNGLIYKMGENRVNRDYARHMALQKPKQYDKKHVSVVAIYREGC